MHKIHSSLDNLITLDEAVFGTINKVNTKNVICYARYGRGHPPQYYIKREQGADKILVWVGLTRNGTVFGPYVIRGNLTTRA